MPCIDRHRHGTSTRFFITQEKFPTALHATSTPVRIERNFDLAEIVGPAGSVTAIERSAKFIEYGKKHCSMRGLEQLHFHELDLMTDQWPEGSYDFSWCRWVASFVSLPPVLIQKLAQALRPQGTAIFHEYMDIGAWRIGRP